MKFGRFNPMAIAAALAVGIMQEAEGQQSSGGSDTGSTDKGTTADGQPRKRAPKTNLLDIVRGRMPLACVAAVRFQVSAEKSNADVAKAFGTSVGKIFDIRKGRNFGYITETYKPSEEDLKAAQAWATEAAKHGGDEAVIMAAVDKLGKASAEEAKSQAEKISASRAKGPRQSAGPKPEAQPAGNAKDLLK